VTVPDGITWDVVRTVSVTDGDTVRVVRRRLINIDGRQYHATDADPKGVPVRLVWVDSPERGKAGWNEARTDLRAWIDMHAFTDEPLRVVIYESAGWDRLLGDLIDPHGNSASQYMLTEGNGGVGWPAYEAS
jgi:endonuclease YncB( thermonuclease family)